jgi:hypothetical protein
MDAIQIEAIRACMTAARISDDPVQMSSVRAADPAAVARFQELMNEPVTVNRVDGAGVSEMRVPFAERLEASFAAQQAEYQQRMRGIGALLNPMRSGMISQGEMIRLQYEVQALSFQQNVVSKVIESVSQAIQTLIKNS